MVWGISGAQALVTENRRMTYREVREEALYISEQLRNEGVKKGEIVGVLMEKGWEQIVAVYGILFAGAAYLPLDIHNPQERLLLTMSQSIRETKMTLTNLEEKENLNQNEKIISSIWKEILGIEYVNKKDNFYSVGGDSLLIAQVVTKMRKSIKQLENISWDQLMREVLENPTLEGMSNIISQKEHSIQKMQKTSMSKYIHKYNETENAPVKVISFFHAGTGRLIDYKHMVENLLDKDMSDTQLIGFTYGEYQQYMETPVESLVQDRANLYAETLLEFNVDRYTLVGYCVGGFLALETAKILLENGKKVKLIMIDSRLCQHTISNQLLMEYAYGLSMELDMDNTPYSIKPVMLKEALEKILNGENRNIKNSELTKLSDEYAELGEVFTNLLDMTHEERIKALFNSKKQHNFNGEESMVFQNVYLFNDTIYNNILMGRSDATENEVIQAAKQAHCYDFIMQLPEKFQTKVGEGGASLSGGEKQRISIARSILKNAPIVILDEATASVDSDNERYIQEAINELVRGKVLLVIAHRLKTIANANQILVIDNGKIVETGTHDKLLKKGGVYANLFNKSNRKTGWEL